MNYENQNEYFQDIEGLLRDAIVSTLIRLMEDRPSYFYIHFFDGETALYGYAHDREEEVEIGILDEHEIAVKAPCGTFAFRLKDPRLDRFVQFLRFKGNCKRDEELDWFRTNMVDEEDKLRALDMVK